MRSKTTFTFEDEATYKSFAAGARENKNFNLEILENAVIFLEVYTAKTTYKQRGRKIQNWKSSTHFDKTSTHFQ